MSGGTPGASDIDSAHGKAHVGELIFGNRAQFQCYVVKLTEHGQSGHGERHQAGNSQRAHAGRVRHTVSDTPDLGLRPITQTPRCGHRGGSGLGSAPGRLARPGAPHLRHDAFSAIH